MDDLASGKIATDCMLMYKVLPTLFTFSTLLVYAMLPQISGLLA